MNRDIYFPVKLGSFLLLLAVVSGQSRDFDDILGQFEFIYHRDHSMHLGITQDKCYFVSLSYTPEWRLDPKHRNQTETLLVSYIQLNDPRHIRPSSLETVRDMYHDLLADFHCLHKRIFLVSR